MNSIEMNFFNALQAAGYEGSCTSESQLRQALRLGAASWQYEEIVEWLEVELLDDREIYACMQPIIMQMRHSTIDQSSQRDFQLLPYQFRCNMLELLVAMLCIAQRRQELALPDPPEHGLNLELESSTQSNPHPIDLAWLVVDRSKATGAISAENMDIFITVLEEKIADEGSAAYVNSINVGYVEACPGLYLVRCSDFKQVSDMLLAFATLPSLWEGEDLCLLPWSRYNQFMFSSVWLSIRRPYGTSEDLLDMINEQNDMDIKSLGFLSNEEDDMYLLQLSPREMMLVRRREGKLKLGGGHIKLLLNQDMGTWIDLKDLQESNNDDSIVSR